MSRRTIMIALGIAAMFTAIDVLVQVRYGIDPTFQYVGEIAGILAWTIGGAVAYALRPANRTGLIILGLGLVFAVNTARGDSLANRSWPLILLATLGSLITPLQWTVAIHAALAFPSGILPGRRTVAFVRTCYGLAGFGPLLTLLGTPPRRCPSCASPSGLGVLSEDLTSAGYNLDRALFVTLIVVAFGFYCRRLVTVSRRQRRVLVYPTVGLIVAAVCAILMLLVEALRVGTSTHGILAQSVVISGAAAMPVGFLLGLLRERLDQARVSDLVARIATTPLAALDPAIAKALGDPSAFLVFITADGDRVDATGRPVAPGPDMRLTPVSDDVFLLHDRDLDTQPELLSGVGSAAALGLENARLRAEVLAQLDEVRASRARLVEAADAARRRLERNLHDGAQQRLISLGLGLRLIRQRLETADGETLALFADAETQTREAIRELRDLARGIHPTILSEQGLAAALDQLANRCPIPVTLDIEQPRRLPASIEATAYFVACEALANVAKHAAASAASLRLTADHGGIVLTVADDGVGGARPVAGSGLAGLADRVAAVGGSLTVASEHGCGTRVTASIPQHPPN